MQAPAPAPTNADLPTAGEGALLPEAKDLNDILSHVGGMDLLVASMKGGVHE